MTGYAVFNPDAKSQKAHPDYGTCEAVLVDATEEEATNRLRRFEEVNPSKQFELRSWPSGERVGR